MSSRFDNLFWGVSLNDDAHQGMDFSYIPSSGGGFVAVQLNHYDADADNGQGNMSPNKLWKGPGNDLAQRLWDCKVRFLVMIYHVDLLRYSQCGLTQPQFRAIKLGMKDVQFAAYLKEAKNTFLHRDAACVTVLNFTRTREDCTGTEVDPTWVPIIIEKVLRDYRRLIDEANEKVPTINCKRIFPMMNEYIMRSKYTAASMGFKGEPLAATDHNVSGIGQFIPASTWEELAIWRPTDQIMGADGEIHQGPNLSYMPDWGVWLNAGYALDLPGMQGETVGAAYFNMTREEAVEEYGFVLPSVVIAEPEPEPDPDPEPPAPEPEPPVPQVPQPSGVKPRGIDVSYWQEGIDWDKVANQPDDPIRFVGVRASLGSRYADPRFAENWAGAKAVGLLRAAYHVVLPDVSAEAQMEKFFSVVEDAPGELPLVLDVEIDNNQSPAGVQNVVYQCSGMIAAKYGRRPMIYSRAQWIDVFLIGPGATPPAWLNEHDWWLAHYLAGGAEHPGPPPMPRGVKRNRAKIHQTSQKGDGKAIGVTSHAVDLNRWLGTLEDLLVYAGGMETAPTMEEKVRRLWEAHPELHAERPV